MVENYLFAYKASLSRRPSASQLLDTLLLAAARLTSLYDAVFLFSRFASNGQTASWGLASLDVASLHFYGLLRSLYDRTPLLLRPTADSNGISSALDLAESRTHTRNARARTSQSGNAPTLSRTCTSTRSALSMLRLTLR